MIGVKVAVPSVVFLTTSTSAAAPAPAPAPAVVPVLPVVPVAPVAALIYVLTRVIFATDPQSNYGGHCRTPRVSPRCVRDK